MLPKRVRTAGPGIHRPRDAPVLANLLSLMTYVHFLPTGKRDPFGTRKKRSETRTGVDG